MSVRERELRVFVPEPLLRSPVIAGSCNVPVSYHSHSFTHCTRFGPFPVVPSRGLNSRCCISEIAPATSVRYRKQHERCNFWAALHETMCIWSFLLKEAEQHENRRHHAQLNCKQQSLLIRRISFGAVLQLRHATSHYQSIAIYQLCTWGF